MYDKYKVIAIAEQEVGYHEKASNAKLDDKTANSGSGNWTKYARDLDDLGDFYNGGKNGFAWCDVFVDDCFVKAYGKEAAMKLLCQPLRSAGAGCYYSAMYYRQKGQFHTQGPQVGDQIFFSYKAGEVSHTGLVVAVTGGYVTTIEGNTSDQVAHRSYALGSGSIYGYGRPDWSLGGDDQEGSTPVPVSPPTDEVITRVAQEVIAGKWGNGTERVMRLTSAGYDYTLVQERVNDILAGRVTPAADPDQEPAPTPGTTATYTLELTELTQGAAGSAVRRVQAMLIDLGYKCGGPVRNGRETPDEQFGPTTRSAVGGFQKANALTVTGKIDQATMKALLK